MRNHKDKSGIHTKTRQAFTGQETNKTSIHTVRDHQDRCSSMGDHQVKTGVHRVRDQQDKYLQCEGPSRQDIHTVEGPPRQDRHSQCERPPRQDKANIHSVRNHQDKTGIHTMEGSPRQDRHSQCSVISYAGNDQSLIFHHKRTTTKNQ